MNTIKSLITIAALSASATAMAQDSKTGYFNENYLYRHEMNPALGNEKGYVSMPFVLGNMSLGMGGNFGAGNVLFNRGGKTVTFMHPDVAVGDVKYKNNNKITQELKYQLLSVGFEGIGGYNTIELNLRENLGVRVPGDIFRLAKSGVTNTTYDLSNLGATAAAYVELGLGHSHQIDEQWRVGGKFKFLVGAGRVDAIARTATVTLGENEYVAAVDAEIHASVKGLKYKQDEKGRFNGIDKIDGAGVGGFGAAFDLGAEYKMDDNWTFSAAVVDLGFIKWNCDNLAANGGLQTFKTSGYVFNVDDKAANSFEETFDQMGEDLKNLYQLKDQGDKGGRTTGIGTTINLGANWRATFYDKLTFGLMNSTRIHGKYSWTDFRLSANVRPVKCVSASANLSVGTYGVGFGWMLDFQAPKGIDFFIAMDRTPGKLAKQGVPLNSNLQCSMGINFPF